MVFSEQLGDAPRALRIALDQLHLVLLLERLRQRKPMLPPPAITTRRAGRLFLARSRS